MDCNKSRKSGCIDTVFRAVVAICMLLTWVTVMWSFSATPSYDDKEARRNIATTGGIVFGVILHNAYAEESVRWSKDAGESFWSYFKNGMLRPLVEAPDFDGVTRAIEKTGQLFPRYAVVLYENDSEDRTADKMRAWASQNKQVCPCSGVWWVSTVMVGGRLKNSVADDPLAGALHIRTAPAERRLRFRLSHRSWLANAPFVVCGRPGWDRVKYFRFVVFMSCTHRLLFATT